MKYKLMVLAFMCDKYSVFIRSLKRSNLLCHHLPVDSVYEAAYYYQLYG